VREGVKVQTIAAGKIRRYLNPLAIMQNIIDSLIKIPFGTIQAFFKLMFIGPDIIFQRRLRIISGGNVSANIGHTCFLARI